MSNTVNNAATKAVESGSYATERSKQEVKGANQTAPDPPSSDWKASDVVSGIHEAAAEAAETAKETLPTPEVKSGDPIADLQSGLKAKTNDATAEGKKDIHDASVTSAGYVQQAKDLGAATLDTVQSYVRAGSEALAPAPESSGVLASVQSAASSALGTTAGYISSAAQTVQPQAQAAANATASGAQATREAVTPYVQSATETVGLYVDSAKDTVGPYVQSAKDSVQPTVDSATNTAKPYLQSVKETVEPKVDAAGNAAKPYADSAKETVQPKVDAAADATKPYLHSAKETVQPTVDATANAAKPYTDAAKEKTGLGEVSGKQGAKY